MMRFLPRLATLMLLLMAAWVVVARALGGVLPDDELLVSAMMPEGRGNLDVYRLDLTHQLRYRMTDEPGPDFEAVWSPDGQHIAFVSNRENVLSYQVYVMAAESGQVRRLSTRPQPQRRPIWSPDSQTVVYQQETGNQNQLIFVNLQSSETHPMIAGTDASWSPDNRYLTFVTNFNQANRPHILNLDLNASSTVQVMSASDWTEKPAWSPDGRYILYTLYGKNDDTKVHLFLWDVDHARSIPLYSTVHAEDRLGYDWSPDSRYMIYIAPTDYGKGATVNGYTGVFRLDIQACLQQPDQCTPELLTHIPGFYQNPHWRPHTS